MKDRIQQIHDAGLLAAFLIPVALLAFFVVAGVQKKAENGLAQAVQAVLTESYGEIYHDIVPVRLQTPAASSVSVFSVLSDDVLAENPSYAVLVRATGFSGSVPLVFLVEDGKSTFAGTPLTADLSGSSLFTYGISEQMIAFWCKRVFSFIPDNADGEKL